jgi:FlaA1/EpsC-like NDP-sugar epimerase
MLWGKTILIRGGTGSFGKQCCREIPQRFDPEEVIIFSRDELKQSEMAANSYPEEPYAMIANLELAIQPAEACPSNPCRHLYSLNADS